MTSKGGSGTTPLPPEEERSHEPRRIAFGAEALPVNVEYIAMPTTSPAGTKPALSDPWRIQLINEESQVLGLDLYDDTVLGRGPEVIEVGGLDLTSWQAVEKGVSRRHALLRPTASRLYLIDMNSSNGTQHNSVPLGPGMARPVTNGDMIVLGDLAFTIRLIKAPASGGAKPSAPDAG